jgi:undecaprenyl diphosphate synthase
MSNQSWQQSLSADDKEIHDKLSALGKIPKHVAVIMDGNGRWAVERGLPRVAGHQEGINSVREIVRASSQVGIEYLTLYAFSMENWKRPTSEVNVLMRLLKHYLQAEIDELHANNVRLQAVGKLNALPKGVQKILFDSIERTKDNTGLKLTLALSYSGRWDLVRAVQMIALDVRRGNVSPEDITEEKFASYLLTSTMPDPDLLIRTSGEMRLSNFLLWEMAYSEIYITNKYWPQFRRAELYEALLDFITRERRFGMTSQQLQQSDATEAQTQKSTYFQWLLNAFNSR